MQAEKVAQAAAKMKKRIEDGDYGSPAFRCADYPTPRSGATGPGGRYLPSSHRRRLLSRRCAPGSQLCRGPHDRLQRNWGDGEVTEFGKATRRRRPAGESFQVRDSDAAADRRAEPFFHLRRRGPGGRIVQFAISSPPTVRFDRLV